MSDIARHHQCSHKEFTLITNTATQKLEEVDFERGLWSAAINGDVARTGELLRKGIDPNILDASGYTPLHYASRYIISVKSFFFSVKYLFLGGEEWKYVRY